MYICMYILCSVREKRKGASDVKWLKNVISSGTLSDKVAAHTLLVQVCRITHTHTHTKMHTSSHTHALSLSLSLTHTHTIKRTQCVSYMYTCASHKKTFYDSLTDCMAHIELNVDVYM